MSPFARKRARQVLSLALFGGILLASSGVLLVAESERALAADPVPVTITSPADASYAYSPDVTFSGTAPVGDGIKLTTGEGLNCVATADSSGVWSCVVYGMTTKANIEVGAFGDIDSAVNSAVVMFSLITVPSINGTVGQNITSSDPQPALSGTADPGALVSVTIGPSSCTATAGATGAWSCDISPALPDAAGYGDSTYPMLANQAPAWAAGHKSHDTPDTYLLRRRLPDPTFSVPIDTAAAAGGTAYLTDPTPTLIGQAAPNAHVNVTYGLDGGSSWSFCSVDAGASGHFTCPLGDTPSMTIGNTYYVRAVQSDGVHPGSSGTANLMYLDMVAPPSIPVITSPASNYTSSRPTVTVSGTGTDGDTVYVGVDNAPACTARVAGGLWTCTTQDLLPDEHQINAYAADQHGNVSSTGESASFTILAPPNAPIVLTPTDGFTSTERTVSVSGTSDGATVVVRVDGSPACTAAVATDGTWGCTTATLARGIHTISAISKDSYGTSSAASANTTITIASPAPAAPPVVISPRPTPTPTPTPTDTPTPSPTSPPSDSKLAITGDSKAHGSHAAPIQTFDSPTTFSTSLSAITATKITAVGAAVSGGVAGGFILLVAFPSELLKNTIAQNYETAFVWLTPTRRWLARVKRRANQVRINPWLGGSVVIVIAALMLGFAEPTFGFNGSSMRLWLALVLSLAAVNLVVPAITGLVSRRRFAAPITLRPLPGALLLVLASTLISRVGHIEPGFLFAGVIGASFGAKLTRPTAGRLALVSVGASVALGLGAWLGYSAIAPLAAAHPSFWNLLWSEVLSATTIGALATLVISLLPLRFLDGMTLFAWKKWVWAVTYFAALVILIFVIAPISDNWGAERAPLFGWGVFFLLFALAALGVWALFRVRSRGGEAHATKLAK